MTFLATIVAPLSSLTTTANDAAFEELGTAFPVVLLVVVLLLVLLVVVLLAVLVLLVVLLVADFPPEDDALEAVLLDDFPPEVDPLEAAPVLDALLKDVLVEVVP